MVAFAVIRDHNLINKITMHFKVLKKCLDNIHIIELD